MPLKRLRSKYLLSASIITIMAVVVTGMADAVVGVVLGAAAVVVVVLGAAAGDGTVAADLTSSGGDHYE